MDKAEMTLRLVLLNILMFGKSERTEKDYQKLLRDCAYDVSGCDDPEAPTVAQGWLQSHGFV